MKNTAVSLALIGGLTVFLFVALIFGLPTGPVDESNSLWITAIRAEQSKDLALLAELFAFFEILGSIEIGADFIVSGSVEIGRAFAAFIETLEGAMAAVFISSALFEAWSLLLKVCSHVASPLLALALAFAILTIAAGQTPYLKFLLPTSKLCLFTACALFLMSWIIVPYAFNASSWASKRVAALAQDDHFNVVQNLHADLAPTKAMSKPQRFWDEKKNVQSAFENGHDALPHKIGLLTRYIVARIFYSLTIGLLIPLFLSFFIWMVLRQLYEGLREHIEKISSDLKQDTPPVEPK